jgi:two-component system response regulator HupR/HoxA
VAHRILVVDDEPRGLELLARILRDLGEVESAGSGEEAWELAKRREFDVVVSDQRMPETTGIELLARLARQDPFVGRILLTAYADLADTIDAINVGQVHAYVKKPCEPEELLLTVQCVLERIRVTREKARAGREPALLGASQAMAEVLERIRQVAPSRVPVLILGETGTGKELVARAVHRLSGRAGGPLVAVNCGAMPDSLLESELFGFRRGAFTGADFSRQGLFEQASGGTLFLDEIGDTTPALQAKLLRAIEEQEVRPLGATETVRVDARVVSATHRDLDAAVEEGAFRQDLLYRLNTVTIHVPPLRERREDIPVLAQHFADQFGEEHARRITLGEDFLEALCERDLPGNVRELRNAVERAIALTPPGEPVSAKRLGQLDGPASSPRARRRGTLRERVRQVEIEAIQEALLRCEGNRTRAAQALGLSRLGLRQKMRRLGLERSPLG